MRFIDDRPSPSLDYDVLISYLGRMLPDLKVCAPVPFSSLLRKLSEQELEEIAGEVASVKVIDPVKKRRPAPPLKGEVDYEAGRLKGKGAVGIVYDGFSLQAIMHGLTYADSPAIIFTDRLFASWDRGDLRYHLRAGIYGPTALISTTGIVEAPAKPRKYYLGGKKKALLSREEYIDRGDDRLTDVAIGYVMQAVMYLLTGDPFCDDPDCRLYNAHWQQELIRSQLGGEYEYCLHHQKLINNLGKLH